MPAAKLRCYATKPRNWGGRRRKSPGRRPTRAAASIKGHRGTKTGGAGRGRENHCFNGAVQYFCCNAPKERLYSCLGTRRVLRTESRVLAGHHERGLISRGRRIACASQTPPSEIEGSPPWPKT